MSQLVIKVGGGEVLTSSTPGHADGRYRVYLDVDNVAGTATIDMTVQSLRGIGRPGNLLGALATVSLVLSTMQQHGASDK